MADANTRTTTVEETRTVDDPMAPLRSLVAFILAVVAAVVLYVSGVFTRISEFFAGLNQPQTVYEQPIETTTVAQTPADPNYQANTSTYPGTSGSTPSYGENGASQNGASQNGTGPLAISAANGAALKFVIIPIPDAASRRGVCVVYAVTNRTSQSVFVALDGQSVAGLSDRAGPEPQGIVIQPGETKVYAFAGFDDPYVREAAIRGRYASYTYGDPLYQNGPDREYDLTPCARIEVTS